MQNDSFQEKCIPGLFLIFLTVSTVSAEEIRVGLEQLPPLIVDENTGYTVDLLEKIEKNSDFTFRIIIMNYIRAKKMLKEKKPDELMQKANPQGIFKEYLKYADMPEQGVFELPEE